jgi:hypothetical protein
VSNVEGERKMQHGQVDPPTSRKTDADLKRAVELLIELRALRTEPGGPDIAHRQVANMLDVVDFLLAQYITEP